MILAIIHSVRVVILGGLFLVDNVGLKTNRIIRCFPSITSRSNKVSLRSYYITTHQSFCTFSNLFFVSHSLPGRTRKMGDLQPGDVVRLKNDSNLAFLVLIFVM